MEARQLTLNLVPGGVLPRIKVSQYDKGVPVVATVYDGDNLYTIPSAAQVYVQGTKRDGTLYQYLCGHSGSIVTFSTTQQMTVTAGENISEISIHYNGSIVGTVNFVIWVEDGSLTDPAQSSIDDIPVIADLPGLVEHVEELESDAEAWAVGQRGGIDVPGSDETYHNNSKYYAQLAEEATADLSGYVTQAEAAAARSATSAGLAVFSAESAASSRTAAQLSASSADTAAGLALGYATEAEESARLAEAWSSNPPYIGSNGNWWVYDVADEEFKDSGIDASITMQIADITMLAPEASPAVTNTGTSTDAVFHLFIPRGLTGKGIASVERISKVGLVSTYKMTYTDGTYFEYTLNDGVGIPSVTKTASSGRVDTYTITYSIGATSTFTITNGADGEGSVSTVNHVDPVGGNVQLKVTDLDVVGLAGQIIGLTEDNKLGLLEAACHKVVTSTGTIMPQRSKLKFLNASVSDDAENDTTVVEPEGGAAEVFSVDLASGELIYTNDVTFTFLINTSTGNLEWEVN